MQNVVRDFVPNLQSKMSVKFSISLCFRLLWHNIKQIKGNIYKILQILLF